MQSHAPPSSAPRRPTLVITYGWGFGTPGGVARHIHELSRALGRAGARVIVICVNAANYSRYPRPKIPESMQGRAIEAELAPLGVEVIRVEPHPLHWMLDGRPVRRAVEQVLAREKVDLVLGFFNEAAYLPDLLAKRGVPFGTIATWLSYRMALDPKRMGKGLRRMLLERGYRRFVIEPYRRASVIFANSEFTRGELIDVVGCDSKRIRVTYLGVASTFFGVPRAKPTKIDRFVFFGRLVPEKGIEDALRALGKLARAGKRDWIFRVMGSGAHDHVRRVAAEEGIAERIELSDHQGDATLKAELERAQVAILPSWSESFGLSIAEAQAAGLPVVGYLAGSVPEIVENGKTAWLAPLRDVDALTRAIETSMRDPDATYQAGLAGRERVRARFRWEETAAQVLSAVAVYAPQE